MPTKRLPASADINHLKHQAKDLLADFRAGQMAALQRVREFHPKMTGLPDAELKRQTFALSDAFLSIAREYGYSSWPRLKEVLAEARSEELELSHNERIEDTAFRQAIDFMDEGNAAALQKHLADHPGLIHQTAKFEGGNYFVTPTLLEFIAENPMRQNKMPANVVEIARILLEAGAKTNQTALDETVMLVASGQVAREAKAQNPLLSALCAHGADPNAGMHAALAHKELASARHLLSLGAELTIEAAAVLSRTSELQGMLRSADQDALQSALALAALQNDGTVITMILRAGADPNRYNPPGGHSHCTPLHSAAHDGNLDTVKALIAGGARTDIGDIHHGATAVQWARHVGQKEVLEYFVSLT